MIAPELKERLTELARSHYGKALKDYLEIKIKDLDSISLVGDDNFEINARANKKAVIILKDMFSFLGKLNIDIKTKQKNPYK